MTFADAINDFLRSRLPEILKEIAQRSALEIHKHIETNFHEGVRGGGSKEDKYKGVGKNTTNKLYVNSGNLTQSFIRNNRRGQNIFNITDEREKLKLEFGTKVVYARIHELGGTAGRGANIPKRPYFAPALKKFEEEDLQKLTSKIFTELQTWINK